MRMELCFLHDLFLADFGASAPAIADDRGGARPHGAPHIEDAVNAELAVDGHMEVLDA